VGSPTTEVGNGNGSAAISNPTDGRDVMSRNCQVSLFGTARWQRPGENAWGRKCNRGIIQNRIEKGREADLCLGYGRAGGSGRGGNRRSAWRRRQRPCRTSRPRRWAAWGAAAGGTRPRCRGSGEVVGGAWGSQLDITGKPTQPGGDAEAAPASPCPAFTDGTD
jgi:hypothetical protein